MSANCLDRHILRSSAFTPNVHLLITQVHTEDTFKNVHDSIFIVTEAWREHTCPSRLDGQIVYTMDYALM